MMHWKSFIAGAFGSYIIATSLVMYPYVAMHPNDNFFKAAIEWPMRLIIVGNAVRTCEMCD